MLLIVIYFWVPKVLDFCRVFGGPGGFRKLREACRKNFHLVAPLEVSWNFLEIFRNIPEKIGDVRKNSLSKSLINICILCTPPPYGEVFWS